MANRTTYEILAKTKGFKNSEKQVKGLNGALGGLAKQALAVGGAYFGARALLDGVNASIEAFGQQELAEKKLEQALGRTSTALLNQASALQSVTTFGDEAIIAQQAFLASLDMTEEQIEEILPVAADLAAATGMSLESAVRNTAKTFSGLAGELGELVPQLRDLTAEQMKAGDAVKVMADLFGGAASAEAETFTGKIQRAKLVMGDMAEDIGSKIAPAVESLADAFLLLFDPSQNPLERQIELNEKYIERLEQTGDMLSVSAGAQSKVNDLKAENIRLQEQLNAIDEDGFTNVEDQIGQRDLIIKQIEDVDAKTFNYGLNLKKLNSETEQFNDFSKQQALAIKMLEKADLGQIYVGAAKDIASAVGANDEFMQGVTIAQAIADTYAGANRALAQGGMFGTASAIAIVAAGLANVRQINQAYKNKQKKQGAQYGFEGVVDEPTQFTVGEGGAAEYVSVQPMEGVNNAGGGGININISGNVMSEQFVEEELAERISEAVRKGVDFGMS